MQQEYTLAQIARLTHGKLYGADSSLKVDSIITDSRRILHPRNALFIALKGPIYDGHDFVKQAYNAGVRAFLVSRSPQDFKLKDGAFIRVENTLDAMQIFAAHHRKQFRGKVIGVTGSNGKTIVKEWLAQIMSTKYRVYRSPGSYNSQIGVPLSVLLLSPEYDFAIIEAGISMPGEMDKLKEIINPEVGILTHLGDAHQENFESFHQKIEEKLLLFKKCSVLVSGVQNSEIRSLVRTFCQNHNIRWVNWGKQPGDILQVLNIQNENGKITLHLQYNKQKFRMVAPFGDKASIENMLTVTSALLAMDENIQWISESIPLLQSVAMRMEIRQGVNQCILINDFYNSDLHGLVSALDFLRQQSFSKRKTLILSDILQSGKPENQLYREVAQLVRDHKLDRFIGIGPAIIRRHEFFGTDAFFFNSTQEALAALAEDDFHREVILLKGARKFHFEDLAAMLEDQSHGTVLEVNLNHLVHNLRFYKSRLRRDTRMMVMVKAFSYGSGMYEIARSLEMGEADYLAVAFTDEGVALRKQGINIPVVVMNAEEDGFRNLLKYNLEPVIYSFHQLEKLVHELKSLGTPEYPVHLKLDTGMHRLGFVQGDMDRLLNELRECRQLFIRSVFSHLAAADDPQYDDFTRQQIKLFHEMSDGISRVLGYKPLMHILNTAGIERFASEQMDMVRLGLGLYGITGNFPEKVQPVSTFKSRVSQVKKIKTGESIGYGRAEIARKDMTIAVIPVGYADGIPVQLGNRTGNIYIAGRKSPVVGKICMDMLMADVSGINVSEGEQVEIFGPNISVTEISRQTGISPYVIISGLSSRVKRTYIRIHE